MSSPGDQELVRSVIANCRYLTLSTCDGGEPWAAPIEFLCDEDLNFYFLSTADCVHARHIEKNPQVALAIFQLDQPAYSSDLTAPLSGVQVRGSAMQLAPGQYPASVAAAVAALSPPMPPYSAFKITPLQFYLPKIVNGVNKREKVEMR